MKKPIIQYLGLFGIVSLISYTVAVLFSSLAYPDYNWMAQAVSDLSAVSAPSKMLWNQLASFYVPSGIVSIMMVCVFIVGKLNKSIRVGIYLFAVMNWVSAVGYAMYPLTDAGNPTGVHNIMHLVVTALVVVLSIVSLIFIIVGGFKKKQYRSLGVWAAIALSFMFIGAIGTNVVPVEYFGIPERFSVFAATGFNAVLGIYLYRGFEVPDITDRIAQ